MDKQEKVDLHVHISRELDNKLRLLEYHSAKTRTFIIEKAIERLEPSSLKDD